MHTAEPKTEAVSSPLYLFVDSFIKWHFILVRHEKIEWNIETTRVEEGKKFLDDDKK
jgi:predicted membrane-bound spermidine synthase